ncbi:MAG: ferritin [Polyangiaceae bacterium]|nr:ferritin [Polyangiaceae bacterium]
MGSESLHEPAELLSPFCKNIHRGIVSLIEELEAVDWYQQRAEATDDAELKAVLIHNRNEEIEHAMMTLEWLRRRFPEVDAHMRTYLFQEGPITEIEERVTGKAGGEGNPGSGGASSAGPMEGSLGLGSLRQAATAGVAQEKEEG